MMSKVIALRLRDEQVERLQRAAHHLGRTLSEAMALAGGARYGVLTLATA